MQNILSLHRATTEQPAPADFLVHFPGFVLQYFDDSPRRDPAKALTSTRYSPEVAARKQAEGCGVYFTPNAFDGRRRLERLLKIQAVYLDIDVAKERDRLSAATIDERKERALLDLLAAEPRPHAVIETKNGLQPIWRVDTDGVRETLRLFRDAMVLLLRRFGGDPAAKDPTRVLRVPGFLHLKTPSAPFRCRLLWNELDAPPHELQNLIDGHYTPPELSEKPVRAIPPPSDPAGDVPDLAEVIRAAAAEAGIAITFRRNPDGSRQILEDGIVTSGFLSTRGNFCYSASGKPRKGGPVQLVRYYLHLDRRAAQTWLRGRFGRQADENAADSLASGPGCGMCVPHPAPDRPAGDPEPPSPASPRQP